MRLLSSLIPLLVCLICPLAWSNAPVVDESENFALLEEQVTDNAAIGSSFNDHPQQALAHEENTSATKTNLDLLNRVNGLQQELQELRGQLDQQILAMKALQTQSGVMPAVASLMPAAEHPNNSAGEQDRYLSAFNLIKRKEFDAAITSMQNFVSDYPAGGYTANAHYWLGELYLQNKDYAQSIKHFDIVLTKSPSSSKNADSLLKMGYALAASGQESAARQRLQAVIAQYPDTHVSKLAHAKLASLGAR